MSPIAKETYEMQCSEIIRLVTSFLPVESWGFHESARFAQRSLFPTIIYDSEWCRIRFTWDGIVGPLDQATMYIDYGRLHVPNNETSQDWSISTVGGEKCHCWHNVNEPLKFLDGLSPRDASEHTWANIIEQFSSLESIKGIASSTQKSVMLHAAIWNQYGKQLFELFDVRRPEHWSQYSEFVREYYRIRGVGIIPIDPPQYKIC